ncbi:hypothetical protein U9M48_034304 [Paspalum notatum var. saurae]|uniref:PIG-P domain-containing protein n=1 Tax=Paspalum notatum var. saurae TaxID=547442 RepID=A0AAQ3U9Q3_PASNO
MEWPPPSTSPSPSLVVRSPRQTVSLIRNRRPQRDWNPSSRSPSFAARDHGPKPSEVYGFVGSITTVIATAVYLAWAYMSEPVLRSLGITYYPSKIATVLISMYFSSKELGHSASNNRYWALAVPSFVIVAVALSMAIYMGLNFVATPPPTSFSTIFDENSRERTTFSPAMEEERPIEPISDISIAQINNLMFSDR